MKNSVRIPVVGTQRYIYGSHTSDPQRYWVCASSFTMVDEVADAMVDATVQESSINGKFFAQKNKHVKKTKKCKPRTPCGLGCARVHAEKCPLFCLVSGVP